MIVVIKLCYHFKEKLSKEIKTTIDIVWRAITEWLAKKLWRKVHVQNIVVLTCMLKLFTLIYKLFTI